MTSQAVLDSLPAPDRLHYQIHSSSGHTAAFSPSLILEDSPSDQASRWTGATNKPSAQDDRRSASGAATPQNPAVPAKRRRREVQYITLELDKPALVTGVGFGKYQKVHPCNLYEFSLWGGMSPEVRYMEPLLHGGLKNDSQPELFPLPVDAVAGTKGKTVLLPVKYIRIDALSAHTQNYNVSIWHVWLEGISSPEHVETAVKSYEAHRLTLTTHLILSHLRRTSPSLLPTFSSLLYSSASNISTTLEHPLLSTLHSTLVVRGNFAAAETILEQMREAGLYREWTVGGGKGKSIGRWERIASPPGKDLPTGRGGHQMIRVGRKLLLFGGWDGEADLGDLWEYELPLTSTSNDVGQWRLISASPSPSEPAPLDRPRGRSCHQLAYDESSGWVYLLGAKLGVEEEEDWVDAQSLLDDQAQAEREADAAARRRDRRGAAGQGAVPAVPTPIAVPTGEPRPRSAASASATNGTTGPTTTNGSEPMDVEEERQPRPAPRNPYKADFWRYKAVGPGKGTWELLSEDTRAVGGPKLIFDHQMLVHSTSQRLFVFGGKNQHDPTESKSSNEADERHSGMFCYDIEKKTWSHLFGDPTPTDTFRSERLLSRFGHSMLYDDRASSIYIFSGQRGDTYLADLWAIKLSTPSNKDDEEDEETMQEDNGLWRAGAVVDAPLAGTSSTSSNPPRQPTILQISLLSSDYSSIGPAAAFTQRASVDPATREWTILSGLIKDRKTGRETPGTEVWTRSKEGKWEEVDQRGEAPVGRYAAQVVYDPLRKEHYMFGGNPSQAGDEDRLNDLWKLRIINPSPEEALRKARFLVRKQRFTEMCQTRPTLVALDYLQTTLASVVDHTDAAEASSFRLCMTALLSAPASNNCEVATTEDGSIVTSEDAESASSVEGDIAEVDEVLYGQRQKLFEQLLDFVPDEDRQPREDLKDLCTRRDLM